MLTEHRLSFSVRGAPRKVVTLFDVRRLARYALHTTMDGHLYEFDQGSFWHTHLLEDEPQREAIADDLAIPLGPWYHHARCDCVFCRCDRGVGPAAAAA